MSPSTLYLFQFLLTGAIAGIFAGMFGIGGGIVLIPALVLVFKFNQITASGLSLTALLLPVGILGVHQYFKAGFIQVYHLKYALFISLGMFFGTYVGARIIQLVPMFWLQRSFAVLMVLVAVKLWISAHR